MTEFAESKKWSYQLGNVLRLSGYLWQILKNVQQKLFFKVHFTACIPDNWYVLYAHLDGRWCIDKSVWLSGPDACKYVLQAWKPTKQSNMMLIHTSSSSTCCFNAHCISFIRKFSTLVRLNFCTLTWLECVLGNAAEQTREHKWI